MFDFGFSELIVIGVVMLIVVGPERLPKVARTAGHVLGRLQRYVTDVKSDIQREMQLEDLKKLQQQVEQQARELESSVRGQMAKVETEAANTAVEVKAGLTGAARAPVVEAVPANAGSSGETVSGHVAPGPGGAAQGGARTATQSTGEVKASGDDPDTQLQLHLDPAISSRPAEKT